MHGISLNDQLLGGPNLIKSLHPILMKFQTKKVAFMCEISAFFHVADEDIDSFRYLWFKDRDGDGRLFPGKMEI